MKYGINERVQETEPLGGHYLFATVPFINWQISNLTLQCTRSMKQSLFKEDNNQLELLKGRSYCIMLCV